MGGGHLGIKCPRLPLIFQMCDYCGYVNKQFDVLMCNVKKNNNALFSLGTGIPQFI